MSVKDVNQSPAAHANSSSRGLFTLIEICLVNGHIMGLSSSLRGHTERLHRRAISHAYELGLQSESLISSNPSVHMVYKVTSKAA